MWGVRRMASWPELSHPWLFSGPQAMSKREERLYGARDWVNVVRCVWLRQTRNRKEIARRLYYEAEVKRWRGGDGYQDGERDPFTPPSCLLWLQLTKDWWGHYMEEWSWVVSAANVTPNWWGEMVNAHVQSGSFPMKRWFGREGRRRRRAGTWIGRQLECLVHTALRGKMSWPKKWVEEWRGERTLL